MKHCIQSTTIDRQGQAALGDCRARQWRPGSAKAQRCASRSVIAESNPNDPTAVLDPVSNHLAGLTRGLHGLRVGVDSARYCCRCNPLWVT
jgi:hypothetical protein